MDQKAGADTRGKGLWVLLCVVCRVRVRAFPFAVPSFAGVGVTRRSDSKLAVNILMGVVSCLMILIAGGGGREIAGTQRQWVVVASTRLRGRSRGSASGASARPAPPRAESKVRELTVTLVQMLGLGFFLYVSSYSCTAAVRSVQVV